MINCDRKSIKRISRYVVCFSDRIFVRGNGNKEGKNDLQLYIFGCCCRLMFIRVCVSWVISDGIWFFCNWQCWAQRKQGEVNLTNQFFFLSLYLGLLIGLCINYNLIIFVSSFRGMENGFFRITQTRQCGCNYSIKFLEFNFKRKINRYFNIQ